MARVLAGLGIQFEQRVEHRRWRLDLLERGGQGGHIDETRRQRLAQVIDAREFGDFVREARNLEAAACRIDGHALECGNRAVRQRELVVVHVIHHDLLVALEAVGEMEYKKGLALDPDGRAAVQRQQGDTHAQIGPPLQHRLAGLRGLHIEHRRPGDKDHVVLCQDEVMDHRGHRQFHGSRAHQHSGGVDAMELHRGRAPAIFQRIQIARARMAPVVGAQPQRFGAARGPLAQRGQFLVHLVAGRGLVQRDKAPAMEDDVDESAVLDGRWHFARQERGRIDGYGMREAAEDRPARAALHRQTLRFHVAVAVAGLPVLDVDGVDHPIAVERIGVGDGLEFRVRSVAHVHAAQVGGNPPGDHPQVANVGLALHREEVGAQVRIVVGPGHIHRLVGSGQRP
ncbi:hypothetical protein D3C72_1291120 [compost metagenome]